MCMCAVMACGVSKQKLTASDGAGLITLASASLYTAIRL